MMNALTTVLLSLLGLVLVVILAAFIAITAYLHYQHRKFAHLPRPEPFNFYFGHFPAINNVIKDGTPLDILFIEWYYQCGPVFVFHIFHQHSIVFFNPKDAKEIYMNTKMYKPAEVFEKLGYIFGQRFLGVGLLTEPRYEVWRPRRSIYDPAFKKAHLKTLIPAFNECVDRMVEKLTPLADGVTLVPMMKEFSTVTLNAISKVAFGRDFHSWCSDMPELKKEGEEREEELRGLLDHTKKGLQLSFYYLFFNYLHPFRARSYRKTAEALRRIGRECIQERLNAIEKGEQVPNDILTQIISVTKTNDNITLEDLVDDFVTFYFAGQDTTSNLLSFSLVLMLQHPNVLSRVVEEVTEVLGDHEDVTAEDIEKLTYTLQVFQETLRLYPPIGGTYRATAEEIELGGYKIPKDARVSTTTLAACRLPENFENPERFDPSRFSPDRPKPDPFVYAPFSRGHHFCIGQTFTLIEGRIILARLLKKFRFSLPADYKLEMQQWTVIQPKGLIPCTLMPIHKTE